MDKFKSYLYYKGEDKNPFTDFGKSFWWTVEKEAATRNDKKQSGLLSDTMTHYLKEKMWQGDAMSDTSEKEFLERAEELYISGLWSRSYLTTKAYTMGQVILENTK